jgi:hypothetical protein
MKQVCVNLATCSWTRVTTRGAALPTLVTAMPDPRSIKDPAAGPLDEDRQRGADPAGDGSGPALHQRARAWPGHLGDQAALLGDRRQGRGQDCGLDRCGVGHGDTIL